MSCTENIDLTRRSLLGGGAASLAMWSLLPKAALAGTRDPRLLTVVLRGGLDGLSLAAPVGDPDYGKLRQHIAMAAPGQGIAAGLQLDSLFALNPNMPFLHSLYTKKEALIVHAVHTPYRERSHFDGQDVLESGLAGVGRTDQGWLNRALVGLPSAGGVNPKGLSIGPVVPLVMRGKAQVLSWIPKIYNLPLRDSTVARLMDLYTHIDPALAEALAAGMDIHRVAEAGAAMAAAAPAAAQAPTETLQMAGGGTMTMPQQPAQPNAALFREFTEAAEAAAKFLSAADGPRIGALSYNGWDTHANEGVIQGQLGNRLAGLDAAIKALADGLGAAWKDTVVMIVTEFGRTARVNGTSGTDHGMATCALVVGGAVKGGRMLADWPGLADGSLYEARDLKPTRDLRTVMKGVLRDHLGVPEGALGETIFPGSATVKPAADLIG
jgi:uncharacterized protein (DUF1501 family)